MSLSMRIEFQVTSDPEGQRPTVGDLQRWLDQARKNGVQDSEELLVMTDERDDVEGFFVFAWPRD